MKDKTTAVPASQVCERVCVFQSFSETVQRDEGQNYSCTCQPGVWVCVCVSVILRNCAERWRTKLQLYLPARCVSVCVFQSFSDNCAERWRTKLHLYLPARCVSVCVCFSHSQITVQRDEGQNYSCTCQPGVWACVCVCFSHSQITVQRDEGQNYSCTCQPGVWACVCVSVILRNCAERWRTKLQLYLPARCVSVCVCFSHSQKLCREMKDKTTAVPASQVCEHVCVFQSFSETVCLLAQWLWWKLQGFDLSCIICVLTGISHLHTYIHRWSIYN